MPADRDHKPLQRGTICVELDGVLSLHDAQSGPQWWRAQPRPGAGQFLCSLHADGYTIVVHTPRQTDLVWVWLREHGINQHVEHVTAVKLPAVAYIDAKGVAFNGDFTSALFAVERLAGLRK